ncbi:hypothetical protein D3C73_1093830 [compost metagenome]
MYMEWTTIINLIDPKLIIVVAVCWVVGLFLKQTPRVPNWTIVYIVSLVAMVFTVALLGFTPQAFLQGILCGAVAVYGHQLIQQARKVEGDRE